MVHSVRRAGQWRESIAPLFPRYLFLQLDEGREALGPVRSSVGVAGIVRFGASYAIVSERIMAELREREDPQTGLHRLAKRPLLARGAAVHITTGPFEGLEGVFERAAGSDRVVVLLNLLGQDAQVRIPADFVLPGYAV
jgi:transcriptional antiterminator RfaH